MKQLRDTFTYCAHCRGKLQPMGHHKRCPDCGKHYFFNGIPSVSIIVINDKQEILLAKREREPYKDWWDLPGGFVDAGETLEAAVARELLEETGLVAHAATYLGSYTEDYQYRDEIHPVVASVFQATVKDVTAIKAADDVSDCTFVKIKELDISSIAFENQRKFLQTLTLQS